jgi:EAL domain-containing protein (putative c-di-GMP-specific phosphodiesterase class I)
MEVNPPEAITNNVVGTKNLLDLAIKHDVSNFVMISTDKAVNPTNVMGASKRTAEMLVLKAAKTSGKPFVVVRFGNVLGSRGSVVPTFKQQIAKGGPVTITHPEICRYFMTIPEAVQLVLQASVLSSKNSQGQIFMLNMGEPVKIVDLAKDLIHLSGYEVGKDIDIIFTGLRPGEKLYEELLIPGEQYDPTPHEKLLVVKNASRIIPEDLNTTVKVLSKAAQKNDVNLILYLLDRLVDGYTPKYRQIEVEKAQDSLEEIIQELCHLNLPQTSIETESGNYLSLSTAADLEKLCDREFESKLRQALENEEFTLYYQPVINLQTQEIEEFEALLRWHHPQLGIIAPRQFMAIAESSGLITPIGRWIVETTCRQLQIWQQEFTWPSHWSISINISSQQLLQESLVKHLQYNLEKYAIQPQNLKLEISEHIIRDNPQVAMSMIPQIQQLGISLQIDNFGGLSALSGYFQPNLLYQQFEKAKIDRYLIERIDRDLESWSICRHLISRVAKSGLEVVATGIQSPSQLQQLQTTECKYAQGHLFFKPLTSDAIGKLMQEQQTATMRKIN